MFRTAMKPCEVDWIYFSLWCSVFICTLSLLNFLLAIVVNGAHLKHPPVQLDCFDTLHRAD